MGIKTPKSRSILACNYVKNFITIRRSVKFKTPITLAPFMCDSKLTIEADRPLKFQRTKTLAPLMCLSKFNIEAYRPLKFQKTKVLAPLMCDSGLANFIYDWTWRTTFYGTSASPTPSPKTKKNK